MAITPLPSPHWHVGEWWRVRVHALVGTFADHGGEVTLHDAPNRFTIYRYAVVGQFTLRYQMGDRFGHHIGEAVPPERCWVVRMRQEAAPPGVVLDASVYELSYRTSDLALRGIVRDPQNGKTRWFMIGRFTEYLFEWPRFPLTDTASGQTIQRVSPIPGNGIRVVLKADDTITQDWHPGRPWWDHADRDGRSNADLIETSEDKKPEKIISREPRRDTPNPP